MIRPILLAPHVCLSTPARPATIETVNAEALRQDLIDTVQNDPRGIGLASPQIGLSIRALVLKTAEHGWLFMMNPRITQRSHFTITATEGCLSLPGYTRERTRSKSVKVTYLTEDWKRAKVHLKDIEAVCFQHEENHLNGVTILDEIY